MLFVDLVCFGQNREKFINLLQTTLLDVVLRLKPSNWFRPVTIDVVIPWAVVLSFILFYEIGNYLQNRFSKGFQCVFSF